MDRAGRVGADVLHLPALVLADGDVAEMGARLQDGENLALQPTVAESNVDESWPRQFGCADQVCGRQVVEDGLGKLARVDFVAGRLADGGRRYQRHIGAVVAVAFLFGVGDLDGRHVKRVQIAFRLRRGDGLGEQLLQSIDQHVRLSVR